MWCSKRPRCAATVIAEAAAPDLARIPSSVRGHRWSGSRGGQRSREPSTPPLKVGSRFPIHEAGSGFSIFLLVSSSSSLFLFAG